MSESKGKREWEDRPPKVTAVVLNWNGGAINRSCLRALLRSGFDGSDILFVDNCSSDGSDRNMVRLFPQVRHLKLKSNLGFCGGNNRGIREALEDGSELILLMNNDVVVDPDFLRPLIEAVRERPGMAGPKVLDDRGKIWCAGGSLSFHQNLTRLRGHGRIDNGSFEQREAVDYLPGCCLLVERSVFEKIGFLDEDYFCYLEDVDFCIRARKAGFDVTFCPDSRVLHYFSHSTGGGYTPARKYMNALNSVRFLKKHGSLRSWLAFLLLDCVSLPALYLIRLLQGRADGVTAKARGILDGLSGRKVSPESLKRFRRIEEER